MMKSKKIIWPKGPTKWTKDGILHISIPFTWNLPDVKFELSGLRIWKKVIVGGPAVYLFPAFFKDLGFVEVGTSYNRVLQKVNSLATRTTTGCIRRCEFCAVRKIEGKFKELKDWPDLPIICDNNLLAANKKHFDKVIDRLVKWEWADFNQGLDSRLLKKHHAKRLSEIKHPMIRLALDNISYQKPWEKALNKLLSCNISKTNIRSYALIGFNSGPDEAWKRLQFIEECGVTVLPMWFNRLDSLKANVVTSNQRKLGWNVDEKKQIMYWYYKHRDHKKQKCQKEIQRNSPVPFAASNFVE